MAHDQLTGMKSQSRKNVGSRQWKEEDIGSSRRVNVNVMSVRKLIVFKQTTIHDIIRFFVYYNEQVEKRRWKKVY